MTIKLIIQIWWSVLNTIKSKKLISFTEMVLLKFPQNNDTVKRCLCSLQSTTKGVSGK